MAFVEAGAQPWHYHYAARNAGTTWSPTGYWTYYCYYVLGGFDVCSDRR